MLKIKTAIIKTKFEGITTENKASWLGIRITSVN